MIDREDLHALVEHNVAYHAPTDLARVRHESVRDATLAYARCMIQVCPVTDELITGLGKLTDEVMVLFNAAIARHHDELT